MFRLVLCFVCLLPSLPCAAWEVINELEFPYSWIRILWDEETERAAVLKQVKQEEEDQQLHLVIDALCAEIACDLGIPCNEVQMIGPGELQQLKHYAERPATLHSWVEGALAEMTEEWRDLEVGQRIRPPGSQLYEAYGPLPPERRGLTPTVLKEMARHPDLPPIVALDTFIGNRDRWGNNLFWQQERGRFAAIDFGEGYLHNLAEAAREQLNYWRRDAEELREDRTLAAATRSYLATLQVVLQTWPMWRVRERFAELSSHAELKPSEKYRENIGASWSSSYALEAELLDLYWQIWGAGTRAALF